MRQDKNRGASMKRALPGSSASSFSISRVTRRSGVLVLTLVSTLAIGGCASQQPITHASQDLVAPMPIELRQRTDAVDLRVFANSELRLDLGDTLEGSSSEERTAAGAKGAMTGAGYIAMGGCYPQYALLWLLTCPAGLVIGAGVAIVGSIGSGIYGHASAWSRDDINAAKAALGQTQLQTNLANELRDRLVTTLHASGAVRVLKSDTEPIAAIRSESDGASPVVLAIDIETFDVREVGEISPDLWIDFEVSGGLYEVPDFQFLYRRGWRLSTKLGNYHALTSAGGLGLRTKLDAAFDKMAFAIAHDLFMTEMPPAPERDDDLNGVVVTSYTDQPSDTGVKASNREKTLSSYLLYLAEREIAYPKGLNTQPPQPTAAEFSATLAALKLSFDRDELSNKEYTQKQRAVLDEYTRNTRAGPGIKTASSSGMPMRIALLPFANLRSVDFDATFYDYVHAYVGMHEDLELAFSEYDTRFEQGLAGTEAEVWKRNFTQKSLNEYGIVRGAKRVNADLAMLISYGQTGGIQINSFAFSVYVLDVETNEIYTKKGTDLNYKKVIEEAFNFVSRDGTRNVPPTESKAALLVTTAEEAPVQQREIRVPEQLRIALLPADGWSLAGSGNSASAERRLHQFAREILIESGHPVVDRGEEANYYRGKIWAGGHSSNRKLNVAYAVSEGRKLEADGVLTFKYILRGNKGGYNADVDVVLVDVATSHVYQASGSSKALRGNTEHVLHLFVKSDRVVVAGSRQPASIAGAHWAKRVPTAAPKQSITVGILAPGFNRPTSPTNNDLEEQIHGDIRRSIRSNPSLTVAYDYAARGEIGPSDVHSVWQGNAVKKTPDSARMEAIGKELGVDCLVLAWIKNMWAKAEIDLYVFGVAENRMHQRTMDLREANRLVGSTISMCQTPT
jgi:hypothetical protein